MSCGDSKHSNANSEAISETVTDVNAILETIDDPATAAAAAPEHGPVSERDWGPLFHGTDQKFEIGDIITPRGRKIAFAASDLSTARIFSKRGERTGNGCYVYEVEPVGPFTDNEVWEQQMKYSDGRHEVCSRTGFRVVGIVPKSRRDSHYDKARDKAHAHNTALGYAYCPQCRDTHLPDDHLPA